MGLKSKLLTEIKATYEDDTHEPRAPKILGRQVVSQCSFTDVEGLCMYCDVIGRRSMLSLLGLLHFHMSFLMLT